MWVPARPLRVRPSFAGPTMEEPGGAGRGREGGGGGGGVGRPEEWILYWDFATIANPRQVCSWLTAFTLAGDNATRLSSNRCWFFILQNSFFGNCEITKLGNRAKHYEPRAQGGFQPNTNHCAPLHRQLLCISKPTQDFSCESVSGCPVSLLFFFLPQKYHVQSGSHSVGVFRPGVCILEFAAAGQSGFCAHGVRAGVSIG